MDNGQIILVIIGLLVSVSSIGGFVLSVMAFSKRNPPLPEEMAKTYVRRDEFKSEISRLEKRIDTNIRDFKSSLQGVIATIDKLRVTVQTQASSTERALGRIEGALGTKEGSR